MEGLSYKMRTLTIVLHTAADHEPASSQYCSFAHVLSETNPPKLGQIRMCF